MIKDFTGIEPSHELNPDEAVAIGAAYYADSRSSRERGSKGKAERQIKVKDVNSHSLGIICHDREGRAYVGFVIKRNTPIPASNEEVFRTMWDGQIELEIQVTEGEEEDPDYDRIIGTSHILMREPRPAGSPLGISMLYDEDGIVHVRVRDLVDGSDLGEMHITRDANLSEEDVEEKKIVIKELDIE